MHPFPLLSDANHQARWHFGWALGANRGGSAGCLWCADTYNPPAKPKGWKPGVVILVLRTAGYFAGNWRIASYSLKEVSNSSSYHSAVAMVHVRPKLKFGLKRMKLLGAEMIQNHKASPSFMVFTTDWYHLCVLFHQIIYRIPA